MLHGEHGSVSKLERRATTAMGRNCEDFLGGWHYGTSSGLPAWRGSILEEAGILGLLKGG